MSEREPPLGEDLRRAPESPPASAGGSISEPEWLPAEREQSGEVAPVEPAGPTEETATHTGHPRAPNMLPGRARRTHVVERLVVRLIATGGVIGIGVGIAAILAANSVQGWIIGLVVATVSVVLSAILWSSRQL